MAYLDLAVGRALLHLKGWSKHPSRWTLLPPTSPAGGHWATPWRRTRTSWTWGRGSPCSRAGRGPLCRAQGGAPGVQAPGPPWGRPCRAVPGAAWQSRSPSPWGLAAERRREGEWCYWRNVLTQRKCEGRQTDGLTYTQTEGQTASQSEWQGSTPRERAEREGEREREMGGTKLLCDFWVSSWPLWLCRRGIYNCEAIWVWSLCVAETAFIVVKGKMIYVCLSVSKHFSILCSQYSNQHTMWSLLE